MNGAKRKQLEGQFEEVLPASAPADFKVSADTATLPTQLFVKPPLSIADARDGTWTTRPLTEVGNALRLRDQHGMKLRFVSEIKSWITWDGTAWRWDNSGASVRELAASLAGQIYREGATFDMRDAECFAKWARNSQNSRTINAAVSLLSDQSPIRLPLATIDANSMLIGFDRARQVVDLQTGHARPASLDDYVTKSLRLCTIGRSSEAVRWHSFLQQIFAGDADLIDWLQRWCGYLLTGSTSEQIFLFFFGLGANGKSVFAETIRHVLGDYGRTVATETLTESKRNAGSASPDLYDLIGCRLAMSSETEDGSALAESLIKSLTSGDTMTARPLYGTPVQFQPTFKLLMLGNHRPMIRGTDTGIWRRVRLIPFNRIFSEQERDLHLLEQLKAEAPHVLAWMIEGCMKWHQRGLSDLPASVASQTAEYRQEQDIVGQWLEECTKCDSASETEAGDLYANYQNWANTNGLRAATNVSLGRRLSERGFLRQRGHGKRFWLGITLITHVYVS